jgi:hypothetical protein
MLILEKTPSNSYVSFGFIIAKNFMNSINRTLYYNAKTAEYQSAASAFLAVGSTVL